ncbi:MAG: terminase large subunit [Gemmatimonadales bacterium]|nr:terminase large subunit [Gemmatimonadales bacterium]
MTTTAPPAVHAATQYALDVQSGAVVAGPWVRLAAERHLRDLDRQDTDGFPYIFDAERADKVIRFFRFVRFYEGPRAGEPFTLEPFQVFIVASLFGWVRPDGRRRFTTGYVEQGKGNGKTPMAAVLGLYMLMADGEAGAQVYNVATKYDQAMLSFRAAHAFAESSPELSPRLIIDKTNIAHAKTNSFMRPIGNRVSGQSGPIPSCTIADEIHEMKDPDVLNMQRRGTKSRWQALTMEFTNAGEGEEGIAWEHHTKSIKVVQGVLEDEQWFGFVAGLDEGDNFFSDESCWPKANPGIGTILPWEYVRAQVKEGLEILSARNNVLRLNGCVWTATHTAWLDLEAFDRGRTDRADFAALVADATRAYGGVDLSETIAMTAYVEGWRLPAVAAKSIDEEEDTEAVRGLGRVAVRAHFFLPENGILEREQRDGVPYFAWSQEGHITLTPGDVVDYEFIRKRLEDSATDGITQIGFDPWHARDLISRMEAGGSPVVEVPQSFTMLSDPCKQLERLIAAGWLLWEDNPVLRWHASNAVAKRDPNGNIKPDKSDPRAFIDGISALVTMLALMLRDPGEEPYSFEIDYLDM